MVFCSSSRVKKCNAHLYLEHLIFPKNNKTLFDNKIAHFATFCYYLRGERERERVRMGGEGKGDILTPCRIR